MKIPITNHAYERAQERLGLNHSAFANLIERVKEKGISHANIKGNFRRYIDAMFMKHRSKQIRVYGENMFVFGYDDVNITVFKVPLRFRKYALKLIK